MSSIKRHKLHKTAFFSELFQIMPKKLVSRSKKESNNNHDLTAKEIAIMYGKEISLNFSKSKQLQKKIND